MKLYNTNVHIARNDNVYTTVKGKTRVYPSIMVTLSRKIDGVKVTLNRRFSNTFGNIQTAQTEAHNFAWFASKLNNKRFQQIRRSRGRPRLSHYFATDSL